MNEIRMYVEHLFEGKVLTAEMSELKEEIYGAGGRGCRGKRLRAFAYG